LGVGDRWILIDGNKVVICVEVVQRRIELCRHLQLVLIERCSTWSMASCSCVIRSMTRLPFRDGQRRAFQKFGRLHFRLGVATAPIQSSSTRDDAERETSRLALETQILPPKSP
jgi:hypothetical protein